MFDHLGNRLSQSREELLPFASSSLSRIRSPTSLNRGLSTALWLLLTAELILGGPSGLSIFDVHVRYLLWGIAIGFSMIRSLCNDQLPQWQFAGLALLFGFELFWGIILPYLHGGNEQLLASLAESKACVGYLLIPMAARATEQLGQITMIRAAAYLVALAGIVVIACWTSANIFGDSAMADALRTWMTNPETAESMIGPIQDGTYRVYWEVAIFFPISIIALWRHPWFIAWAILFITASYCSGSRAILAASLIATVASAGNWRNLLGAVLILCIAVTLLYLLSPSLADQRVFTVDAEFSNGTARGDQLHWLLDLFRKNYALGAGFGAVADGVRSESAAWSYELTYVSLLAKIGVLGSCWLVLTVSVFCASTHMSRARHRRAWASVGLCFLLVTAFNPVLLTAFGTWLVVLLLAIAPRDSLPVRDRFAADYSTRGSLEAVPSRTSGGRVIRRGTRPFDAQIPPQA